MKKVCSLRALWDPYTLQMLLVGFLLYFVTAEGRPAKENPMKKLSSSESPCQKRIGEVQLYKNRNSSS